jgi:hypothetical protein
MLCGFSVPFAILATTGVLPARESLPLAVPRRSWCLSQIARREALAEPPGRVFSAGRIGFTIAFFQYVDSKLGAVEFRSAVSWNVLGIRWLWNPSVPFRLWPGGRGRPILDWVPIAGGRGEAHLVGIFSGQQG